MDCLVSLAGRAEGDPESRRWLGWRNFDSGNTKPPHDWRVCKRVKIGGLTKELLFYLAGSSCRFESEQSGYWVHSFGFLNLNHHMAGWRIRSATTEFETYKACEIAVVSLPRVRCKEASGVEDNRTYSEPGRLYEASGVSPPRCVTTRIPGLACLAPLYLSAFQAASCPYYAHITIAKWTIFNRSKFFRFIFEREHA